MYVATNRAAPTVLILEISNTNFSWSILDLQCDLITCFHTGAHNSIYFHMFLILPVWLNLWTFQKFATKKAVFLNHDRPLLNSVINTYICHIFEQICFFINICSWFSHPCRNFFCLHLCTFCAIFLGWKVDSSIFDWIWIGLVGSA